MRGPEQMLNLAGEPQQSPGDPTMPPLTSWQLTVLTLVIIAIKLLLTTLVLLFCEPSCHLGWEQYRGSCYFFSWGSWPWQKARNNCLVQNADLLVIGDPREQDYLVRKANSTRYWIGFTDQRSEGIWRWVDNSNVTVTYWSTGEPNNEVLVSTAGENCAHMLETGLWNDGPCTFSYKWICERAASV